MRRKRNRLRDNEVMHYASRFLNREIPRYLPRYFAVSTSLYRINRSEFKVPPFVSAIEYLS